MRRILTVAAGILLLAPCMAGAGTAKATPKGVQNSKKVMQHNIERIKKVQETKKRAHAQKEQARAQAKMNRDQSAK